MADRRAFCALPLLLVLAGTPAANAAESSLISQIRADRDRLRVLTGDEKRASPGWKDAKPDFEKTLLRIDDDLVGGRPLRGLELLGSARDQVSAFGRLDPSKDNLAAFGTAWTAASDGLSAASKRSGERTWDGTPAAIRAISEASQGKSLILLEASRAFAGATNAEAGYYYLHQAISASEFAAFGSSLSAARQGSPYPLRSIAPELEVLQDKTNAAFEPPRSIDLHSNFIRLNATLKQAGELDRAGLFAGALYQYLDAVQQFGLIEIAAPNASEQDELRREIEELGSRFSASQRDDSLGQLFVQRAAEAIATARPNPPQEAEAWRRVRAIVERVLPAYAAMPASSPAATHVAATNAVTVTLVRWPYT